MAERVLIVDDDPVQRRLLENMAAKAGYETVLVGCDEAALQAMRDGTAVARPPITSASRRRNCSQY
jgi:CheY-like chemotaxis protein